MFLQHSAYHPSIPGHSSSRSCTPLNLNILSSITLYFLLLGLGDYPLERLQLTRRSPAVHPSSFE